MAVRTIVVLGAGGVVLIAAHIVEVRVGGVDGTGTLEERHGE